MNKPKPKNEKGDRLSYEEYLALIYKLTIEAASALSNKSMVDINRNITNILISMPVKERKKLARSAQENLSQLYSIFDSTLQ